VKSIQEIGQQIKNGGEDAIHEWGLVLIVFLVALTSFGLGRLSMAERVQPPISIASAPQEAQPRGMYIGGLLVASRTGGTYYYPWCAGASKIATQNQVWFQDEASAQKVGYVPAKNCKGLSAQ